MSDILEYKCPCCGGAIEFNSRLQKMKCPYCDTEFELDTLKQFEEEDKKEAKDPQWDADNVAQSNEQIGDDGTFKTYVCDSCGGEARVPFQPREGRPVYCSACFAKMREEA